MARELYEKQEWENLPSQKTPVTAESLLHMEDGIYQNSENMALKEIYGDNNVSLGRTPGSTIGQFSMTFGYDNEASQVASVAFGQRNISSGVSSFAGGLLTAARGDASCTEGYSTMAIGAYQHVQGKFNIPNPNFAHIVGNGKNDIDRSNAHTLDWNGNAWFAGDVTTKSGTSLDSIGIQEAVDIDFSTYFT